MAESDGFTPTERRIMDLLADNQWHSRYDLKALLDDDLASMKALGQHIFNLRAKLKPNHLIVCELYQGRQIGYRYASKNTDPA